MSSPRVAFGQSGSHHPDSESRYNWLNRSVLIEIFEFREVKIAVYNRISEFHDDMTRIRRDIHSHPETAFEEELTAKVVADELEA